MRLKVLAAAAGLMLLGLSSQGQAAEARPAPKLVIVISVDQLSSNLYNQYRPSFTGGLKTLTTEGLVYANGYQTHGATETCPGHSTILTGKHPAKTGIPANDWWDRERQAEVYCFYAPQNTLADGGKGDNGPVGPDQMTATTLGDWMKAGGGRGRVYAVSGKDRGALALGGHQADGVFWFQKGFGFTTWVGPGQSAEAKLAPMAGLNARIDARFKAEPPGWTYRHDQCRKLEGEYRIGGQSWRSTLPPARFAIENSPVLDELTLEAATTLLEEQKLGQGDGVDILGVSLSATDRIGHGFGTQGPEICEQLLRLDEGLGAFLARAEELVPGGVIVVLTADHGGSDFPERTVDRGYPEAGRGDLGMLARVNGVLMARFKLKDPPIAFHEGGLYIEGPKDKPFSEARRREIATAAVEALRKEPDVAAAYTSEELLATPPAPAWAEPQDLSVRERMALSTVAVRSPDIQVALRPGLTFGPGRVGGAISSHGSPWDYDRRVPILFWWPGAQGQERFMPIRTVDIGPTLAHLLGVAPPADVDGRCLDLGGFAVAACPAPAKPAAPQEAATQKSAPKSGFRWPWEKPAS